uniref:Glutathione S-transferase C-terminal domain-containing protein n=1 Tax=Romanomermis culicivorax TaxID=13658 RepID=A0A915IYH2_ROMCU
MAMACYLAKEHGKFRGELWQAYKKEHLPSFLDIYEKLLTENGGKFFVGNQVWLYCVLNDDLTK